MSKKNKQKSHWCFTLFPKMDMFGNEEVINVALKSMIENLPNVRYSIFQLEVAPKTGKIHCQGYIEFLKPIRFTKMTKLFTFEGFGKPHVEWRKKSRIAARNYCLKSDTKLEGLDCVEIGEWREPSHKRKSNDFATCAELIELGWDEIDIAGKRPELFLRYGDKIKRCIEARKLYNYRCENRKRFLSETEDNEQE